MTTEPKLTRKTAAPRPRKPRAEARTLPARTDMRLTAWVAFGIIVVDQLLKYWVVHVMNLDRLRAIDVFPPWLNLRMAWNQGVNFGLFASEENLMRWILVAVAAAVCAWVWIWLWRSRASVLARVSAGLLLGGAIGNVIDRLIYGAVADFLNMSLPNWQNPYSFNVADIAIFVGAIGLVLMPAERPEEIAPPPKKAAPARKATPKPADEATDKTRDGG